MQTMTARLITRSTVSGNEVLEPSGCTGGLLVRTGCMQAIFYRAITRMITNRDAPLE